MYYGYCPYCDDAVRLSSNGRCSKCNGTIERGSKIKNAVYDNLYNKFSRLTDIELQNAMYREGYTSVAKAIIKNLNNERKSSNEKHSDRYSWAGPFEGQDLVYSFDGVRGRHIDIYRDKVVLTTKVTIGSILTHNATDGEKTIYYSDCIGIQFKPSSLTIGYLQFETASSSGNNQSGNFFNENSFTYDQNVMSNKKMEEVVNFVKKQIDDIKKGKNQPLPAQNNTNLPLIADELLKLKQLVDMGVLTQEEFEAKKKQLLGL